MTAPEPTRKAHKIARYHRAQFLSIAGGIACGVGLGALSRRQVAAASEEPTLLRPPGAADERDFLAACSRCGQCIEVCPYDVLHLADLSTGASAGTPYFTAREDPCTLCMEYDIMPCIDVCPTSALNEVPEPGAVTIGVAVLDENRCLAYHQTSCRACWHACPWPDGAISLDGLLRARVHPCQCVGCGLCEHACPTEPSSIIIHPRGSEAAENASGPHRGAGRHRGEGRGEGRGLGRSRNTTHSDDDEEGSGEPAPELHRAHEEEGEVDH